MIEIKQDIIAEGARATPAIAGATYSMMTLNEMVALATLVYIILQALILAHKHYHWMKKNK